METTSVDVQLEFTPNPDSLKYVVNRTLLLSGGRNFANAAAAEGKSLLAERLFTLPEVSSVMVGTNFVTVSMKDVKDLNEFNDRVRGVIKTFLENGHQAVSPEAETTPTSLTEIEQKIIRILDEDVRPAVAMDGGDITFEKYEDGFVYLRMQGACSGCPSSLMTLKMGVETRLKQAIPEIQEVIPV